MQAGPGPGSTPNRLIVCTAACRNGNLTSISGFTTARVHNYQNGSCIVAAVIDNSGATTRAITVNHTSGVNWVACATWSGYNVKQVSAYGVGSNGTTSGTAPFNVAHAAGGWVVSIGWVLLTSGVMTWGGGMVGRWNQYATGNLGKAGGADRIIGSGAAGSTAAGPTNSGFGQMGAGASWAPVDPP